MAEKSSKTVDDYIAGFPTDVQRRLKQMRATIRKAAPGATETRFPFDEPLPLALVTRMVKFRVRACR